MRQRLKKDDSNCNNNEKHSFLPGCDRNNNNHAIPPGRNGNVINNVTSAPGRNWNSINNITRASSHNSYYNYINVDNDAHLADSEFNIPDNNISNDSTLKYFATEYDTHLESDVDSYAKIQDEDNGKIAGPNHELGMTKIGKIYDSSEITYKTHKQHDVEHYESTITLQNILGLKNDSKIENVIDSMTSNYTDAVLLQEAWMSSNSVVPVHGHETFYHGLSSDVRRRGEWGVAINLYPKIYQFFEEAKGEPPMTTSCDRNECNSSRLIEITIKIIGRFK